MRYLIGLFWAFVFFALFAFALNNQQLATVRWFFGVEWRTPMVIVVLAAFGCGQSGDVRYQRLAHVLFCESSGFDFLRAADFADHQRDFGFWVLFEPFQDVAVRTAGDRVAANAD